LGTLFEVQQSVDVRNERNHSELNWQGEIEMSILSSIASANKNVFYGGLSLAAVVGLSLATAAIADDPTSMAPPIETSNSQAFSTDASANSVFNWQEIPANQQVPLTRAAFDQGGYQLYDQAGETIIVPFTNQNLYVMKFAESPNGKLYFVNEGDYPVLYVPKNGSLENATVAGAHWYPFGQDFHPTEPVFLGIAPSWSDYVSMGWYPDMAYYGGYWGRTSFLAGGLFLPSIGLFFDFGGHPYYGWNGYHHYFANHPDFHHTGYYRPDFYRWAARPRDSFHQFGGVSHAGNAGHFGVAGVHHTFVGARGYSGHQGTAGIHQGFSGTHSGVRGTHTFRGGSGSYQGDHAYSIQRSSGGHQSFSGGHQGVSSGRTFRGGSSSGQQTHSYSVHSRGGRTSDSGHADAGGRSGGGWSGGGGSDHSRR
jgi:hypothetical protein